MRYDAASKGKLWINQSRSVMCLFLCGFCQEWEEGNMSWSIFGSCIHICQEKSTLNFAPHHVILPHCKGKMPHCPSKCGNMAKVGNLHQLLLAGWPAHKKQYILIYMVTLYTREYDLLLVGSPWPFQLDSCSLICRVTPQTRSHILLSIVTLFNQLLIRCHSSKT